MKAVKRIGRVLVRFKLHTYESFDIRIYFQVTVTNPYGDKCLYSSFSNKDDERKYFITLFESIN